MTLTQIEQELYKNLQSAGTDQATATGYFSEAKNLINESDEFKAYTESLSSLGDSAIPPSPPSLRQFCTRPEIWIDPGSGPARPCGKHSDQSPGKAVGPPC